ncbi:MAG: DUF4340 domain-containing protein [Thermodesulfobacteriota bacterium]
MKVKKEYLALIVVIAALAAYLVLHQTDRTHYKLPRLADLAETKITRIAIEKPGQTIELRKKADQWVIGAEKYRGETEKIEPMTEIIKNLQLTALVSENQNYHPYNLDKENRIIVKAWAGSEQIRSIAVGKPAPSYRHTFVKLADDPRVFHAEKNIRKTFDKTADMLRDKTVLAVDRKQVREISVKKGDQSRQLALTEPDVDVDVSEKAGEKEKKKKTEPADKPTWQDAEGNTVAKADVDKLLGAVSDLECKSFMDTKAPEELTVPVYTLELTGSQTHTLHIHAPTGKDANRYPATSSEAEYAFYLAKPKADKIMGHLLGQEKKD